MEILGSNPVSGNPGTFAADAQNMTVPAHRLPLRHWLAIFWFLPVFALRAQFPPDIVRIAATNAPAAIWTTPNSQPQLQVTITPPSSQPIPGQRYLFVAPPHA